MSPDLRVCPSCQTYNLPDASQCLQCGAKLNAGDTRKPTPTPPPLFDPELDHGPFAIPEPRHGYDDQGPAGSLPRFVLGLLISFVFLVFLLISPSLAILGAIFLGPRLLREWRESSRQKPWGAASFPNVFQVVGGTLAALAVLGLVGGFLVLGVIVAVLKEIFD